MKKKCFETLDSFLSFFQIEKNIHNKHLHILFLFISKMLGISLLIIDLMTFVE